MERCPKHIAIIMDGNGRWAKKQGKPRTAGHYKGSENVREIAICANRLGVEVLTLYAFSTENWIRPQEEVNYLMKLPAVFFERYLKELMENNIRVSMIGEIDAFPLDTRNVLLSAIERTRNNTGMVLNFAMNYGSRREITLACREIAEEVKSGIKQIDDINEDDISKHLMTAIYPDVDFMIRTSGECRLSNFLLWQLAYAEFYFTDVAWPDFTPDEFKKAIEVYNNRHRRYGGL
ncbi:MAG: isoprenyl transferase [Erysipelotrichaceae bacterium]|nr:isoprenyl transferase [Erysipelotrichaceae bacterium]